MSEYTFEPFQKVLVRVGDTWYGDFFSHTDEEGYNLVGGVPTSENLIPYEGNEHLLGTTDSPKPKWKPKAGELVAVTDNLENSWKARRFKRWATEETPICIDEWEEDCEEVWKYCEPLRKHFNVPEEA